MKVPPCSVVAVTTCCQSSAGPDTASTLLAESTAQASRPAASQERRRNGASASLLPFGQQALQRRAVGERARGGVRVLGHASQVLARGGGGELHARLALVIGRGRAACRLADQVMPPATSSTSARWIAASHQPRLVRAGSGHSALHSRARRREHRAQRRR